MSKQSVCGDWYWGCVRRVWPIVFYRTSIITGLIKRSEAEVTHTGMRVFWGHTLPYHVGAPEIHPSLKHNSQHHGNETYFFYLIMCKVRFWCITVYHTMYLRSTEFFKCGMFLSKSEPFKLEDVLKCLPGSKAESCLHSADLRFQTCIAC